MKKYSRSQVTKAGKRLKTEDYFDESELESLMDILSYWRFAHEEPLNHAFNLLQQKVLKIDRKAIFGRRLKRYSSIVRKLERFETMQLGNMRDIGGCRAIVSGINKLDKAVRALKKDQRFRDQNGKIQIRDYVKSPKEDGYRSFHLIGKFGQTIESSRFIEIQVRTVIQHDWATTLEVVDLFTGQALKSSMGKASWKKFFFDVAEQFAVMDSISGFAMMSVEEQFQSYSAKVLSSEKVLEACQEAQYSARTVNAVKVLNGFAQSLRILEGRIDESKSEGYVLLKLDVRKRTLETQIFIKSQSEEAEKAYTGLETEHIEDDHIVVALISTAKVNDIRDAYPNFFGDSTDFIRYLSLINAFEIERTRPSSFLRLLIRAGLHRR